MMAWYAFKRHLTVFRRTWWSNVAFNFIEPFLYLSALGIGLGAFIPQIDGISYIQFIAPGMAAAAGMWAATFECTYATFIRLHYQKSFHAMLAAPGTVAEAVTGDILFGALKSMLFGLVILIVIGLWGQIQSPWAGLIPFFLLLPGTVFSLLALSYTGITPHIDYLGYYVTLFITPLYLFAGIFFPVSSMPAWVQYLAWVNPLYHSVEVCRALVLGNIYAALWLHVAILLAYTVCLGWLPAYLFRKRLIT
ncbi:MAG TPA: ABC transporter permease [Firmicutes bacterium]|nr:ABC transporter permease [Bacillota bacterium]